MKYIYKLLDIYKDAFSGLSREIWLLSLTMFINRAGAMVIPFMSIYLTTTRGFSLTRTGWIMGAFGIGSIIGAFIGGMLADRFNHYYIQVTSLFTTAAALFILIYMQDYYSILVNVFCFALISDALRPANSVAIAHYSKPENRTRSFSLMRFAINLGFTVGPAIGGFVYGFWGYKWLFAIDAVTNIMAAILLMIFLPFKKNDQKIIKEAENRLPKSPSAYKDLPYIGFIILVALYGICFFQILSSVPLFLKSIWGYSENTVGLILALNGAIVVLFEMPLVKRLETIQKPMILIAFGCLLMSIGYIFLLNWWVAILPAVLFYILVSFSEMFAMPFMINFAVSRPNEDRRGQYMALYSMGFGLAHVSGPLGSLWFAEHFGYTMLFALLMSLSVVISLLFLVLRSKLYN
ncbi:MAG: MFS transporter [Saprospiraceae bacterium]|nr:MFS transporter [Saprospiraceae bacterium]